MSQRLKMILGLVALIVSAGLIGLLLYFLTIRGITVVEEEAPGEEAVVGGLTGAEEGFVPTVDVGGGEVLVPSAPAEGEVIPVQLTSSMVIEPTLTASGSIAFYNPTDGKFYTIDSSGDIVALSETKFPEAESVVFADGGDQAVIEFPDGSNIVYDFVTESQTNLPSHWQDFDFSPDGEEIVSKSINTDPNSRALVITSSDGSQTKAIAALGTNADKVEVNWSPNDTVVGFSSTGNVQTGFGRQQIYLIGTDGEAVGALVLEGSNFSGLWSPSGNYLLYSIADSGNSYRPSLWFVSASGNDVGENRKKFSLETWVEKCTFASETTAYCAVPRELPNYSGEDSRLVTAPDDVYLVNLSSSRATLVATPISDMQMFDLMISTNGKTLYFTDSRGRLNAIYLD